MLAQRRARFWMEAALAVLALALFVLTLLSPGWIELLWDVDPDGGSGALEWGIAALLLGLFSTFSALGHAEWKKQVVSTAG
jgi:hypothetical protein